jgi:cell division transport system permease protein
VAFTVTEKGRSEMALRADYFFGEALINLRRNLLMTVSAISIVLVSLLLLGFVMVVGQIIDQFTGGLESQVQVNVFLREDITPEQSKDLESAISAMPEVKKVEYLSKEEAFNRFRETYKDSPAVWENVDPGALPASYLIELHRANDAAAVTTRLEGQPGVDDIESGGETLKRLLQFNRVLRLASLGFTVVFLISATMLIANTIRLAIYARRREVAIMRLVGASNWFIRVPFIFEGMLEGIIGAVLAAALIVGTKALILDSLQETLIFLPVTIGWDAVVRIFAWLISVGMAVGALGSAVALRRFLEV